LIGGCTGRPLEECRIVRLCVEEIALKLSCRCSASPDPRDRAAERDNVIVVGDARIAVTSLNAYVLLGHSSRWGHSAGSRRIDRRDDRCCRNVRSHDRFCTPQKPFDDSFGFGSQVTRSDHRHANIENRRRVRGLRNSKPGFVVCYRASHCLKQAEPPGEHGVILLLGRNGPTLVLATQF